MKDVILDFFKKTGKKSEFDLFLNLFHKVPKSKFAVIKISGKTLENHMDKICEDIAFLNRFDIYPIIVHGAGSEIDRQIPNSRKINGYRVTPDPDMEIIKNIFENIAGELRDKINGKGGSAEISRGVFNCVPIPELGRVGNVTGLNADRIGDIINSNKTAIVSPIGYFEDKPMNINADTAAKEVVKKMGVKKFILLTETGGILDDKEKIVPFLNLCSKEDMSHITGGMLLKVKEIGQFLETNPGCEVVITSADHLLKEIFTIKGDGTFIKYFNLNSTKSFDTLEKDRIRYLLESSFKKKLVPDYFEREFKEIFYQKDYEGIAIVSDIDGLPYLDKIAVLDERKGTGLGKSIWEKVIERYPKIIWRAAVNNLINAFYTQRCDGMIKKPDWIVYWKNLEDHEILSMVKTVLRIEKTLV